MGILGFDKIEKVIGQKAGFCWTGPSQGWHRIEAQCGHQKPRSSSKSYLMR